MLTQRVLSAVVLIPVVALLIYLGGWWFTALVAVMGVLAGYEAYAMLRSAGHTPLVLWGLGIVALLPLLAMLDGQERWLPPLLTAAVLLTLVAALAHRSQSPATDWALTVAVAFYLGGLIRYGPLLRNHDHGLGWVVTALLVTWVTDSGAYFVGVRFGQRKMAPRLSPKKTWEGALGGWIVGVLAAAALVPLVLPHLAIWQGLLAGVAVCTVAPFGDLAESMFKRQCGVKDSGHLIPGHGGAFDRIDSLLFVFPAVYALARLWG